MEDEHGTNARSSRVVGRELLTSPTSKATGKNGHIILVLPRVLEISIGHVFFWKSGENGKNINIWVVCVVMSWFGHVLVDNIFWSWFAPQKITSDTTRFLCAMIT